MLNRLCDIQLTNITGGDEVIAVHGPATFIDADRDAGSATRVDTGKGAAFERIVVATGDLGEIRRIVDLS